MKSILTLCTIILAAGMPNGTGAEEMHRISGSDITVHYPAALRNAAHEIVRLYPSVKNELEELFDAPITFAPAILLIQDRNDFQHVAGMLPVVAIALSDGDRIVIDNSRMKTYPFTLRVTLKHELCHLFLYHLAGGGDLPRWLNEGIAQWTSDGIAELITGEYEDILSQAVLSKQLIPLASLDRSFPGDERSLVLVYQQSRSVIGFLSAEYGPQAVVQTLKHLQKSCDIDCALQKGAGLNLPMLEEMWHASLKENVTWIVYVSAHLYQILFILAALLLTYGFIRMVVRKRRYKDEEDGSPNIEGPL